MISSAALPNVALRKPPSVGPDRRASASVPAPINPAAGISAIADVTNTENEGPPRSSTQLTGAATSNTLSHDDVSSRRSCRKRDTAPL